MIEIGSCSVICTTFILIYLFLSVDLYQMSIMLSLINHKDFSFETGAIILMQMQWCICSRAD